MGLSVVLALVMSISIFMLLPTVIVGWMSKPDREHFRSEPVIEGVVRILIFVVYIVLISKLGDIKTVFQYHGAEHKTIHCFEDGLELTPKNAQTFYTLHPKMRNQFSDVCHGRCDLGARLYGMAEWMASCTVKTFGAASYSRNFERTAEMGWKKRQLDCLTSSACRGCIGRN